jgi:hypothetical protein
VTVLDIADFEFLLGLVSQGHYLPDVSGARIAGSETAAGYMKSSTCRCSSCSGLPFSRSAGRRRADDVLFPEAVE